MKKMICVLMILMVSNCFCFVYAEDVSQVPRKVGRHYTVREVVVHDRITQLTNIYPCDVVIGGATSKTSLRRAVVYSEYHYKVYRKRIGDSDYKVFLYDEYKTDWKGQYRLTSSSSWHNHPDYPRQTQVSKERPPYLALAGAFI